LRHLTHGEEENMRRRALLRHTQAIALAGLGAGLATVGQQVQAQTGNRVTVRWLGHTCFLFSGDDQQLLVNPFRAIGCTNGYRQPKVNANLVMISSRLFDEGGAEELPGNPRILFEPGVYQINRLNLQGIPIAHDRHGGRQFGRNVAWRWQQGGITILHLGGAAAPIEIEQKILMGRPDLLLVPVGGGPKAYTPAEAKQAIQALSPKLVIPTHYRTQAAAQTCDLEPLDGFLKEMGSTPVRRANSDTVTLQASDLPSELTIQVLSYAFS
jgi:L-ascorbate metabolism protein UlaG (beta-lactamase superfamily)